MVSTVDCNISPISVLLYLDETSSCCCEGIHKVPKAVGMDDQSKKPERERYMYVD